MEILLCFGFGTMMLFIEDNPPAAIAESIMNTLLGIASVLFLVSLSWTEAKWVEGRVDTKNNWAFLSRFCFLSLEGQFEYLIEFDRDMGLPNLLLYYDDDSQWPSVYHSSKTCKEREQVLNKNGQNQIIKLSHWYPDTEISGCMVTRAHKEIPASKSTTTPKPSNGTTKTPATTSKPKNSSKSEPPIDPAYYDQFLKTTTTAPKTTISDNNSTIWYEIPTTEEGNTTALPEEELWESIGPERNGSHFDNLKDVEWLFESRNNTGRKKRSVPLYERFHQRRLNSESKPKGGNAGENIERLVVSCHNNRRFKSARERWWFIAISNCEGSKGLDVRYKFLMTNGPEGDFWHEHFSADEFYVLPVLLTYTFAYILVMVAVVMCSVELKSRHLLHSTYKLFLVSIVSQHIGIMLQAMAYLKYASNGVGSPNARVVGQFHCGVSESVFLLLLVLMAKGYTITRGRLKPGFAVKLTIFMCGYIAAYVALFVYQAKAFDPGQVLYLYESPAGYGLIVLRVVAWFVFAYSTLFTVKKYPEKNMFYCPFFICGTLWFYAGPLFILTANSYIDKWVRESVVTAVLLFITFSGHLMFLILTLPVFANKNFPYHVRTTQIGVMELTGSSTLDGFGPNAYHPANGVPQTVIIPLTRRTEELIGNMYSQYMATAPPLSLENGSPKLNGVPKRIDLTKTLIQQDSTETNTSDDIKPYLAKDETENHTATKTDVKEISSKDKDVKSNGIFTVSHEMGKLGKDYVQDNMDSLATESLPSDVTVDTSRSELPNVLRSRRNILEPIKMDVPSWSLAKGPCVVAMQKKKSEDPAEIYSSLPPINGNLSNGNAANGSIKKVPPVRNGLQPSSGEISTIHEGHIQSYKNSVSKATIDLFNANNKG